MPGISSLFMVGIGGSVTGAGPWARVFGLIKPKIDNGNNSIRKPNKNNFRMELIKILIFLSLAHFYFFFNSFLVNL